MMKQKYDVFYRKQGCPNSSIYCKTIFARGEQDMWYEAYRAVSEDYTILDIIPR